MHQVDLWQSYNPIKYLSKRKVSRDPSWKLSVPFAVVVDYVRRFPWEYFGQLIKEYRPINKLNYFLLTFSMLILVPSIYECKDSKNTRTVVRLGQTEQVWFRCCIDPHSTTQHSVWYTIYHTHIVIREQLHLTGIRF